MPTGTGFNRNTFFGNPGRNYIINGNFGIWQRGSSFNCYHGGSGTVATTYCTDRWALECVGPSSYLDVVATVTKQEFTLGQTDVVGNPKYYMNILGPSEIPNTYFTVVQKIESVRSLSGKTVTVSFWAKFNVNAFNTTFTVNFRQFFGTGGGSTDVFAGAQNLTVVMQSTSWKRYSFTFDIPSISGKTLGTGNNDYLELRIYSGVPIVTGSVSNMWDIDIANVQVMEGEYTSDFVSRPLAEEIALCQRYYEKSYDLDTPPTTTSTTLGERNWRTSGTSTSHTVSFQVAKRISQSTVNVYSQITGGIDKIRNNSTAADLHYSVGAYVGNSGFFITAGSFCGDGDNLACQWSCDAELD